MRLKNHKESIIKIGMKAIYKFYPSASCTFGTVIRVVNDATYIKWEDESGIYKIYFGENENIEFFG